MMKSVRVKDYMATDLVTLNPETEILVAVSTLIEHDISGAPVVDQRGQLVGMLTEKDCMRVLLNASYYSEYGGRVSEFMTHGAQTLDPDDSILKAAELFLNQRYHRYPVVDNGNLVGQISRRDVMKAIEDLW